MSNMKSEKTFKYCEQCDAPLESLSPPSAEQYENSMITLGDFSTLLLPKKLVKKKTKPGFAESHSESLRGAYCGPKCLKARLDALLAV